MNPFDLRGPDFLIFYTLLAAAALLLVWHLRRSREAGSTRRSLLNDYLQIAYLRGGHYEALRVATMNLINRGLIEVESDSGLRTSVTGEARLTRSTERALLDKFRTSGEAASIFSDLELSATAAADCGPDLMRLGLLPDGEATAARTRLLLVALLVVLGVAATKTVVALSRGRSNVLFLMLEAIVFSVLAYKLAYPFRTEAGDAMLAELTTLFGGLRARAGALTLGAEPQDVALLAAVFGTGALPPSFASARLFRRAQAQASSCGASCGAAASYGSSGSSCGSSSGSSCGGGGGGGGCGGGGGGCGGCGS